MSKQPIESPFPDPKPLARKNWPEYVISPNAPEKLVKSWTKKAISAIAAIADQLGWNLEHIDSLTWPGEKTEEAYEFLLSSRLQLRIICEEPLRVIEKHIDEYCPGVKKQV